MNEMNKRFTHNQYGYSHWEDRGYWCSDAAWNMSDCYREIYVLSQEGIPEDAMHIITNDYDRVGGRRYHRITIDCSANEQVQALADRLHQSWLTQKTIDDERYARQYEEARRNQQTQGAFEVNEQQYRPGDSIY